MTTLTVIVPVYNEQNTVLRVVEKVKAVNIDKEIIIVDDASQDDTPRLLKTLDDDPEIQVITHESNLGRGAGIKTALDHASGLITIFQDGDLELEPTNYPRLTDPILSGESDVVFGSRFLGKGFVQGMGFGAYMANVLLAEMTDRLYKANLTDVLTMFQVMKTDVLRFLNLESDRWESTIEITAKLLRNHFPIKEVPVDYIPRRKETGKKVRWSDFFSCVSALLKYRFRYKPENKYHGKNLPS
jgi:glycosyltransferase involved in cell wall biosynthesis